MTRTHPDIETLLGLPQVQPCIEWAPTEAARRDAAARMIWGHLCESGDNVLNLLIDEIGAETALKLFLAADTAPTFCAALSSRNTTLTTQQVTAAWKRWSPRLLTLSLEDSLRTAAHHGFTPLVAHHPAWPPALNDLGADAPLVLWVRGDTDCLRQPLLAVVGARAISSYGQEITAEFTAFAGTLDLGIISGAAFGIDATAHRTALAQSIPTIAVLAGGFLRPYPAAHRDLLDEIVASGGAVCAEYPPRVSPSRWRFLRRNRIIAALAAATLVAEAGRFSGAINTAAHASHLGRGLGVVPGNITAPGSAGIFRIYRDFDAMLVTRPDDLRQLVAGSRFLTGETHLAEPDDSVTRPPSAHVRVLDAFPLTGYRVLHTLAAAAGMEEAETRRVLAELELLGEVERRERGNHESWCLVPRSPNPGRLRSSRYSKDQPSPSAVSLGSA